MHLARPILFITLLLQLCACNKDLQLPDAGQTKKIVMLGELIAGDSIYLRLGQSLPLTAGNSGGLQLPQDLEVNVSESGGSIYSLSGIEDDMASVLHTIPFSSAQTINAGKTYTVHARHTTMGTAEAALTIPGPFDAAVTDTATVHYINDTVLQFNISIQDNAAEQNYYVIEALQQDDGSPTRSFAAARFYCSDPASDNLASGDSSRLSRRILLSDATFNGATHRFKVLIPRSQIHNNPGIPVRLLLQVKSVSIEYYQFLRSYEQYDPAAGFSISTTPVILKSNVANGLGIVGGVYKHEFAYVF